MSLDLYLAFVAACVVLILIPGPNVALIVANSVAHGTRFGLLTVAGTSSAVVVHLALTVLGATAVLNFLAASFDWLRWAGVAYLVWLGIAAWRAPAVDLCAHRGAGALGAADLRARLPGRPHQSQDAAVLRRLPAAVHHAGSDRGRPAPAAGRDVPRRRRRARRLWAILAGRLRALLVAHARLRNRLTGGLLIGAGVGLALARGHESRKRGPAGPRFRQISCVSIRPARSAAPPCSRACRSRTWC